MKQMKVNIGVFHLNGRRTDVLKRDVALSSTHCIPPIPPSMPPSIHPVVHPSSGTSIMDQMSFEDALSGVTASLCPAASISTQRSEHARAHTHRCIHTFTDTSEHLSFFFLPSSARPSLKTHCQNQPLFAKWL